jgi:hypothetical protein
VSHLSVRVLWDTSTALFAFLPPLRRIRKKMTNIYTISTESNSRNTREVITRRRARSTPSLKSIWTQEQVMQEIKEEIKVTRGQPHMFLRSKTSLCLYLKYLIEQPKVYRYFRYLLRDVFNPNHCVSTDSIYTIDPTINETLCEELALKYATTIINRFKRSMDAPGVSDSPQELRNICFQMIRHYEQAFPSVSSAHVIKSIVGNVLLLRILCPALIQPEMFGYYEYQHPFLRTLAVQIAKALQLTLKDPSFMNKSQLNQDFISKQTDVFLSCLMGFPIEKKQEINKKSITLLKAKRKNSTPMPLSNCRKNKHKIVEHYSL